MKPIALLSLWLFAAGQAGSAPVDLQDQFELPRGFHIYRAADNNLCGGSYDITFDGAGRLLVGDGKAVRRLTDQDNDGVYDGFEVIAEGLGGRGPQGLVVYGDRLYAVGGDGLQLFDGYNAGGPLTHRGRLGAPFHTGGDHGAHTILRGHDGYLYFVSGDGGGVEGRKHITEETSPALIERAASVFRLSPDGARWECWANGGRNPPNLGMNYLGELFSWDSDMEWHVDLPWYRPLRLNHWMQASDQGWQEVSAFPAYYIDTVHPILAYGRGSPTWGAFYEQDQFPERYRDAYFVCDYQWKSATSGDYDTAGRLVVFFLQRAGATWQTTMETFVRPKAGAKDASGKPINFALVDVSVGPDGSLFISDHNQGIWRVTYDPNAERRDSVPAIVPPWAALPETPEALVTSALRLAQLDSERSRLRVEEIKARLGQSFNPGLSAVVLDSARSVRERLQALRLLAPDFRDLPLTFLTALAESNLPELRGQAAWLFGLRSSGQTDPRLITLLNDADPFVRRRAAEALTRSKDVAPVSALIQKLQDPERSVQYVAMTALAHRPIGDWLYLARQRTDVPTQLRALTACQLRAELPSPPVLQAMLEPLLQQDLSPTNELDLLRVLGTYRLQISAHADLLNQVTARLINTFPAPDKNVRWEQARLIGEYRLTAAFDRLMTALENETDRVTEFHYAQAIARLPAGWTKNPDRLRKWFEAHQAGWFAEFEGKGRQFPEFWLTVLTEFARHHRNELLQNLAGIDWASQLGGVVMDLVAAQGEVKTLTQLYSTHTNATVRSGIIKAVGKIGNVEARQMLASQYVRSTDEYIRGILLTALAQSPADSITAPYLIDGLSSAKSSTVVACGRSLAQGKIPLNAAMADALLNQMLQHQEAVPSLSPVLAACSQTRHPDWITGLAKDKPADPRILDYWKKWYADQFQRPFKPGAIKGSEMKDNEALFAFLLQATGGNAQRGGAVYTRLQCQSCHGGPGTNSRLFGPELGGVTRRLKRAELAEAVVYPSKQVAERFRGLEVELKDGRVLTGFLTEQNDARLTLATPDRIEQLPRSTIKEQRSQQTSLMPEGLLNASSWDDLRDLLAYLDSLGTAP